MLLAAGESSRFGGCKLAEYLDGTAMINRAVETVLTSAREDNPIKSICVVTGAYTDLLQPRLNTFSANGISVATIHCPNWREGMGSSLALGAKNLPRADAIAVVLADQVLVTPDDLQNLGAAWCANPANIACAHYNATLGVPAIFPARYRTSLENLGGQSGAKKLINASRNVIPVEMPNAAFDIDTREDYFRISNLLSNRHR